LAARVDVFQAGSLRCRTDGNAQVDAAQLANRAGEFPLLRTRCPVVWRRPQELGTGRITAGATIVEWRIPVLAENPIRACRR
jgi:hypothetical protein